MRRPAAIPPPVSSEASTFDGDTMDVASFVRDLERIARNAEMRRHTMAAASRTDDHESKEQLAKLAALKQQHDGEHAKVRAQRLKYNQAMQRRLERAGSLVADHETAAALKRAAELDEKHREMHRKEHAEARRKAEELRQRVEAASHRSLRHHASTSHIQLATGGSAKNLRQESARAM